MDSKVNPMDKSPSAETINAPAPQVPRTFFQYLRSFGPGIVIAMTWMGAGDVVESAVAGGNYGYALMWVLALALVVRFLFVSLIAKYQLCNQRGEGVLDGLGRLHPWYPPFLALMGVVIGHIQGAYLIVGIGEISVNVTGIGHVWLWGLFWNLVTLIIVFRPVYGRLELLFKILLGLLSVSFLGAALWVGPSPSKILQGVFAFDLPQQVGPFGSLLVAIGLIGTIGGSLANLVYPYFLEQKGWIGPAFRRVQFYDLLLGIVVLIVLDLAIWTLGAEVLHPRGLTIAEMEDLPRLLSTILGEGGRLLFYLGLFAVLYTGLVGQALGFGALCSHGYQRWRAGPEVQLQAYQAHPSYRWVVVWCLISPVVWTAPGMPGFVVMTVFAATALVVLIPLLVGGLWWITAKAEYIGAEYKNRLWENVLMGVLFALGLWGAYGSVKSIAESF